MTSANVNAQAFDGSPVTLRPGAKMGQDTSRSSSDTDISFSGLMRSSLAKKQESASIGGSGKSPKDAYFGFPTNSSADSATGSIDEPVKTNPKDYGNDKLSSGKDSYNDTLRQDNAVYKKATEDISDGIKEAVKTAFDSDDEALNEAMETLSISYIDLLNPQNLENLAEVLSDGGEEAALPADLINGLIASIDDVLDGVVSFDEFAGINPDELISILEDSMTTVGADAVFETSSDVQVPFEVDMPQAENMQDIPSYGQIPPESMTSRTVNDDVTVINIREPDDAAAKVAVASTDDINMDDGAVFADQPNARDDEPRISQPIMQENQNSLNYGSDDARGGAASKDAFREQAGFADVREDAAVIGNEPASQALGTDFSQAITETATPASYTSEQTANIINQIVTQASVTITETVTRMEMELNPANLGRMIMQVTSEQGQVTARLIAQNENVFRALETQMALLRESLIERGIRIDAVEVSVATHEFEENLEQNMKENDMARSGDGSDGDKRRGSSDTGGRGDNNSSQNADINEEELRTRVLRDGGTTVSYSV